MCMRKHYKAYKLYESLEGKIFKSFVEDNNIDYEAMQRDATQQMERSMDADRAAGLKELGEIARRSE